MKSLSEKAVNHSLKSAVGSLSENRAEEILSRPAPKAKGNEWYLQKPRKKRRALYAVIPAAACIVLIIGIYAMINARVSATVYIDINPSIELRANVFDKVVSVKADNSDGEKVLDGMNLVGCDLDVAANAVLGSTVKHGYLGKSKDVVLLSVESPDKEKAAKLSRDLSKSINDSLKSSLGSGTVLKQEVSEDDELPTLAEKYNITVGKAYLIRQIVTLHPELKFDKLAKLSLRDMVNYLRQNKVSISEIIRFTGDDPDDVIEDINESYYGEDYDEDEADDTNDIDDDHDDSDDDDNDDADDDDDDDNDDNDDDDDDDDGDD